MKNYSFYLLIFLFAASFASAEEIKIEADFAKYKETTGEFLISGNLKINYQQEYVTADSAVYNKILDKLLAQGNVKYHDKDGNIYETQKIELSNKFNIGKATKIKVLLKNESIIVADSVIKNNNIETLNDASYTSCQVTCKGSAPLWKINATEVIINRENNTVYYKNAIFKIKNIPVLYTPLFYSYIKQNRKTGLLPPTFIRNSFLGSSIKTPIYFNIAPNQDLVISPIYSQHKNIIFDMEYRFLSTFGKMETNFSYKKKDKSEINEGQKSKNYRGHIFLKANANVKNWYNNIAINLVTDKNYLKNYDFLKKRYFTNYTNFLTSKIDIQKRNSNNNFAFKTLYFQSLAFNKNLEDTTLVLPAITMSKAQTYQNGSKTKQEFDFASIHKKYDVDINRTSVELSYIYPFITSNGIQTNSSFIAHSDVYNYKKQQPLKQQHFKDKARFFPEVKFEAAYPLISTFKKTNFIITPLADISFRPRVNYNKDILFEDSQFNELNFNNVLITSKYSGFDIVESGTRYNYGLRVDLKPSASRNINFLIGQSYFQKIDTNSRLGKSKYSNLVGKFGLVENDSFILNYMYALDHKKYSLVKHSVLLTKIYKKYSFNVAYTAVHDNIRDSNNIANKKELFLENKAKLLENLDVKLFARYDLTSKKDNKIINNNSINKLTKLGGGVTIHHNCAKIDLSGEQDYTHMKSKPNNTYWIRIWLKNLV
jgi:LPS-assembly protein